jgi:tetratricopeptide (TPR) repeat protein
LLLVVLAQAQSAGIAGTVNDGWETAIAQASITLTDLHSGASLSATTDEKGEFSFSQAAPGRYDLTAGAPGFKQYSRRSLEVTAGVRLEIRMNREKEDISAAPPKDDDYQDQFKAGRVYFRKGDFNKAVLGFQAALKLQTDYIPALLGVARVALQSNRPEVALQFASRVLSLRAGGGSATLIAAAAYQKLGKPEDAADLLNDFVKSYPLDADALLEAGIIRLQQKLYADAEEAFGRAYRMDPSNVRGLVGLAEVQLATKHPEKAVEIIAREATRDPGRNGLRKEQAAMEYRAGMYDKALADYQSILDRFKDDPAQQADLYSRIGLVYQKQDDFPRSIESLKKATQIAPTAASYWISLAAAYDLAGNTPEALKAYRQALALGPNNPYLLNNFAYFLAQKGNEADADEALRLVQAARRELADVDEVNDTLGLVYFKKGMVDSACQVFQNLVEKAATNPMFHYHYGVALAKKGDKTAALDQFRLALKNKPDKEEEKEINALIQKLSTAK